MHQQRRMPSGKNKLERYFQISKHYVLNQRENVIFLGNKHLSEDINQNNTVVFGENVWIKCQISTVNLKISKC